MSLKTIKHCAGCYTRTNGKLSVDVTYIDHLRGWIAHADWDHFLYTDPLRTKREAIRNADSMICEVS